ncbi:sensor histidine kinase [Cobetia amphilecti]|uniref:sensor histidine kinase n=1 Tax=Cobetia amphilecti TaxID=1055104 RepID=UPI0032973ECB
MIAPSGVAIPASTRQWLISAIDAGTDSELEPSASPLGTLMALTSEASAIASWLWLGESLAGSLAEPLSESALYPPAIEALSRGLTLQHLQQARQATAIQAAVAQAVQAERRNLAAELHDTLAQELSYLQMQTSRLTRAARQAPSEVQTLAEDVHVQTRRAFRQTRELINGAHAVWGDAPLACVLDDLILEFETRSNMVFELDNRIQSLHLPDAESLQVMFIVREALTNSVRHAHATHLRLQLLYPQADQVSIAIEDNGNGFDPAEIAPTHFGLGIMQDRARSIGAQFSITQRRHGGTRVAICWERNAR